MVGSSLSRNCGVFQTVCVPNPSNYEFLNSLPCDTLENMTEKVMAPRSSTFAWKIPWTEEPGRLQSMGSLPVGHD